MDLYSRDIEIAKKIAEDVHKEGGSVYYVGGYVRDKIINKTNKDIDIEVHGISPGKLESILDRLGERTAIGESFGIYGLKGYSVDIAMPRKEKVRGRGHKDFDVSVDPYIGTMEAAKRRDFTINSLMQDVLTEKIIDHYEGLDDLKNGIIRHVNSESFVEDQLRVLRAAQFAARFNFSVDKETIELCRCMSLNDLPKERIMGEIEKALLKSERPSIFFETLREMDQLDTWFPELKSLIDVPQNSTYHAEKDVWEHTMMVLDQSAKHKDEVSNPLYFMMSALSHDLGKPMTTKIEENKITSIGHEVTGKEIAEQFISRLSNEKKLLEYTSNMTELHMSPLVLSQSNASYKSLNKIYDKSVNPKDLILLSESDYLGRKSAEFDHNKSFPHKKYLEKGLQVYQEYMSRPYVTGKDLVQEGLKPNEHFSEYLQYAHNLRLAGVIKEKALENTISYVISKNYDQKQTNNLVAKKGFKNISRKLEFANSAKYHDLLKNGKVKKINIKSLLDEANQISKKHGIEIPEELKKSLDQNHEVEKIVEKIIKEEKEIRDNYFERFEVKTYAADKAVEKMIQEYENKYPDIKEMIDKAYENKVNESVDIKSSKGQKQFPALDDSFAELQR